ncbi:hypothetical protein DY000_02023648 [Brassica cretica]|uniref:Uncharacterized protein n=1 Tax=Brassica cretica TaxID=69181 RepID=A0ABQ7E0F4_BRACR|nr:hypothetical protein DY000_02023648 [Brassica cretica]
MTILTIGTNSEDVATEHESSGSENGDVVDGLDSALTVAWALIATEKSLNNELRLARWIATERTRRDSDSGAARRGPQRSS